MIDVSGSELFAVCGKAMMGAGVGRALADDSANAALWLHAKGYNGTAAVVQAADGAPSSRSLGMAAVDLLTAQRMPAVLVNEVDSALLLIGFLGVASSQRGVRFVVADATGAPMVTITPSSLSGPADTVTAPLSVTYGQDPADQPGQHGRALRLSVHDRDWADVNAAAARTYVPSNERSRATGAGAGLVDTD